MPRSSVRPDDRPTLVIEMTGTFTVDIGAPPGAATTASGTRPTLVVDPS